MRRLIRYVIPLSVCLLGLSLHAQDAKLTEASQQIGTIVSKSGADVAVALRTLDGAAELFYHADDSFHAASTMKIPVMIELFHQAKEGKLHLDDAFPGRAANSLRW